MKIAITDANIFIDLMYCKLLDKLFGIGLEIHTTINVIDELNAQQQTIIGKSVQKKLLTVHLLKELSLPETIKANKRLSDSDKSVFSLAIQLDALLLSGDGVVRKFSGVQKIEVHGILWLFDQFINSKLITKKTAHLQLKQLLKYNNRLPVEDCEKRLLAWK